MNFDDGKCSHCGRPGCIKLGDPECSAARVKMFDELRQKVDFFERMQAKKRQRQSAAEGSEK